MSIPPTTLNSQSVEMQVNATTPELDTEKIEEVGKIIARAFIDTSLKQKEEKKFQSDKLLPLDHAELQVSLQALLSKSETDKSREEKEPS